MIDPLDRLVAILTDRLEIPEDLVGPDTTLQDLDLDSLALEEFVVLAGEEFDTEADSLADLLTLPLSEAADRLATLTGV
ncbi:MAG: acyl carrier protein [Catenulispora sp.]|nr:acyl carrier protein [Catenulispora sp.]